MVSNVIVRGTSLFYVELGTLAWLKTENGEIRQCKCVGVKWVNSDNDTPHPQHEWKVAGLNGTIFSDWLRPKNGVIYTTKEAARNGRGYNGAPKQIGEIDYNTHTSVVDFLCKKYGLTEKNFVVHNGQFYTTLWVKAYRILTDNSIDMCCVDFEADVTKNGFDIRIPMLDGVVNGYRRYATKEKAMQALKARTKVYSFDDEDESDTQAKTKVKITIEVETENVEQIKKFATIIQGEV